MHDHLVYPDDRHLSSTKANPFHWPDTGLEHSVQCNSQIPEAVILRTGCFMLFYGHALHLE